MFYSVFNGTLEEKGYFYGRESSFRTGWGGYWAIDIGHIDIEYEWFLRKTSDKIKIEGKYVNEVLGGKSNIADCNDEEYKSQIICKIV